MLFIIVLENIRQGDSFVVLLNTGRRPNTFYQRHVEALCVVYTIQIFSVCSRIQRLSLLLHWPTLTDKAFESEDTTSSSESGTLPVQGLLRFAL
ncbi:hypothetical protein C8J56DRAFT_1166388, partial [Mycena floridula]